MKHCPLLKAKSSFLNQGPPLVSIPIQLNPMHTVPSKLFKTYFHDTLPTNHRSSSAVYFLQHFRSYTVLNSFLSQALSANFYIALSYYAVLLSVPKSEGTPLFLCPVRLTFATTLYIWRPCSPSATQGSAMLFWQRAHLTCWEWSPMLTIMWHSALCKNALQKSLSPSRVLLSRLRYVFNWKSCGTWERRQTGSWHFASRRNLITV
jgi:hypothetical protein